MKLDDVLALVGELDDLGGPESSRERFRTYLRKAATLSLVRDYIEQCLREPGPQHNRALQDLVNRSGELLGFKVTNGRYQGVTNAIGFDGLWQTEGLSIVVEVKTTDAYSIKTATLLGYVDALISDNKILLSGLRP